MDDLVTTAEATLTRWSRSDWVSLWGMTVFVVLLHIVGWGVLLLAVVPQDIVLGDAGAFGVGIGLTAYLLGVRHAFDVDHIAVVDNTTRKLVGEGRPALSGGFWFSLGHSSVVFGLALLLSLGCVPSSAPCRTRTPPCSRPSD